MTTSKGPNNLDFIPGHLSISPTQQKTLDELMDKLKTQAPAILLFLADRNGQVIYSYGDLDKNSLGELGALLAGDLAANAEIARNTKSEQEHQLILREGENENSFISEAGDYLILFVQTSSEVPLGWSRLLIQEVSKQLVPVITQSPNGYDAEQFNFGNVGLGEDLAKNIDKLWN